MKLVKRSRTPSFKGQSAEINAVRQHKRIAMGKQGSTAPTKNPGSRGNRIPGMLRS